MMTLGSMTTETASLKIFHISLKSKTEIRVSMVVHFNFVEPFVKWANFRKEEPYMIRSQSGFPKLVAYIERSFTWKQDEQTVFWINMAFISYTIGSTAGLLLCSGRSP